MIPEFQRSGVQRTVVGEDRRQVSLRRRSAPEWNAKPGARGQRTALGEDRGQGNRAPGFSISLGAKRRKPICLLSSQDSVF
ncbi:MAG: hypothetical protein LBD06_09480 [Candidatus Accumulibacter sp.]|nr:hypothetical protein [Accumulibacter sp.]